MPSRELDVVPRHATLPALQVAAEAAPVVVAKLWRHEERERSPQQFRYTVAEDALGGLVGKANRACRINGENGIRGGLRHDAKVLFTRAEGLLRLHAFGHITKDEHHPDKLP